MIEFDVVIRRYGRTVAVDGLTLTIPRGELFALMARTAPARPQHPLAGWPAEPDEGQVRVCGVDCSRSRARPAAF